MADASLTSGLGGGRGGPVLIGGRSFSPASHGLGLSIRDLGALAALGAGELGRPRDNGGSCGGSEGSEGGNDGRSDFDFDLLFLRSRKEGGAGSAFEKRDLPVLGA